MSKGGQIIFNRINETKNGQYNKANKMTTDNEVNFRVRSTPIRVSPATKKNALNSKTDNNSFNNKIICESISSTPILNKKQKPIRCGEIFVANIAARHWTFTCSFCNKSTRDIGEFICHIKIKHLVEDHEQTNDADSDDDIVFNDDYGSSKEDSNSQNNSHINKFFSNNTDAKRRLTFTNNKAIEIIPIISSKQHGKTYPQQTSSSHNSTEFYDYNTYLDVSVHTENNETPPSNKSHLSQNNSKRRSISHSLVANVENKEKNTTAQIETQQQQQKTTITSQPNDENVIVSLIDDDDDEEEEAQIKQTVVESNVARTNKTNVSGNAKIKVRNNLGDESKIRSTRIPIKINNVVSNEKTTQNMEKDAVTSEDQIQEEMQQVGNNNSHISVNTDEENDDFDNQLLIAPDDSNKEDKSANESIKFKRRQIRGSVYCAICKRTFQYYSLYRNHMIKHSNETPFTCAVCHKGFKSKPSIRYHLNTHHKERRIKCELCDATYHTQFQLISHIVLHENETTFPCMVCGKIMTSEKEREVHLTTHTEERPFFCDFCRKRFHKRHHLSNHLKRHRYYRCDYCKEEFRSETHLRKPYACKSCGKLEILDGKLDTENRYQLNSRDNDVSLASSEINPLQLSDGNQQTQETIDCEGSDEMDTWTIDCEDDEEEETEINEANSSETAKNDEEDVDISNSLLMMPKDNVRLDSPKLMRGRFGCKYCGNKYSYKSGLNYHLRMKHS